ncbi:hypothetical protein HOLleu_28451 [Holothuria leucospilota]|uniref:C2H2-type domain-containing protein n=1 Tax=Holothuria leucospilota TaxID=206669 RepID=A0A9Q1BM78_HOLLE|nr:hypothetical protein HOLleu_28451 [Holothuria leucospilota]
MALEYDESSCDTIFDDTLDIFTVEDDEKIRVDVPVVIIPSPKKRVCTNNEPRTGAGRPALQTKYPDLVPSVNNFVRQHGFSAQQRRRSSVGNCGVSLKQIQKHVKENLPEVGIVHTSTLLRLTVPPNRRQSSAKRYSRSVEAKVPAKKNCVRKQNTDSHYLASRVKYRVEFAMQNEQFFSVMSCDTMNKINVGTLAVSRYHQHQRLFPLDDGPNYLDHDFPAGAGYKITPVGHMLLQRKSDENIFAYDELGRLHYRFPRTGPAYIVNRSQKFHALTIETHINDLVPLLHDQVGKDKTMCLLIVDGGPDWNQRSWSVILYMARLFKLCNLDFLCSTSYAPGHSAYNPIEHLWSPLSKTLTGITFPDRLPGETPPSQQTNLSAVEKKAKEAKEAKVFDVAIDSLNALWDGKDFDGFPITSKGQKCLEQSSPFCDYDIIHDLLKHARKATERPDVVEDFAFAMTHGDRRSGEFSLMKCDSEACSYCTAHPPSEAVKKVLNEVRIHGGLPSPSFDPDHPTHYKTYLDAMKCDFEKPDIGLVKHREKGLGSCPVCPAYVFLSLADKVQHTRLLHSKSR